MIFRDSHTYLDHVKHAVPSINSNMENFATLDGTEESIQLAIAWQTDFVCWHLDLLTSLASEKSSNQDYFFPEIIKFFNCMPTFELTRLCQNANFCHLVIRTFSNLQNAKDKNDFDNVTRRFTIYMLRYLAYKKDLISFKASIGSRLTIIDAGWTVYNHTGKTLEVIVTKEKDFFSLKTLLGIELCIIPFSELTCYSTGAGVTFCNESILSGRAKHFVGSTQISKIQNYPVMDTKLTSEVHSPPNQELVRTSIAKSMTILKNVWPECEKNINFYTKIIATFSPADSRNHSSASSRNYPFVMNMMMTQGQELKNLESIVHETLHNKLSMLISSEKLISNTNENFCLTHPWMNTPSPIISVLFAAHAFLGVVELYDRVARSLPEYAKIASEMRDRRLSEVKIVMAELEEKAHFVNKGIAFFEAMRARYLILNAQG